MDVSQQNGVTEGQTLALLVFGLVLSGLGAYNVGPVPLQWIAPFGPVAALCYVVFQGRSIELPKDAWPYVILLVWSTAATFYRLWGSDTDTTLPEYIFVAMRITKIIFFIVVFVCVYSLKDAALDRFERYAVAIGVAVSLYGIYCYFAHLNGWAEIPRTRSGTYEGGQPTVFTYPFHRLMGTFQEPSMFADWILVPLFVAFHRLKKRPFRPWAGIMLGATMLTGSFAAAAAMSVSAMIVLLIWLFSRDKSGWLAVLLNVAIGCLVFYLLVRGYQHSNGYRIEDTSGYSPLELVWLFLTDRVVPALAEGASATNRAAEFAYAETVGNDWLGQGLGLANLQKQEAIGASSPVSFLSLYSFFRASTGIPGLLILLAAIIFPIIPFISPRNFGQSWRHIQRLTWILALYISCCIMFYAVMEELTFTFAVSLGLLAAWRDTDPILPPTETGSLVDMGCQLQTPHNASDRGSPDNA